ncbi:hypothetical protein E2562_024959 [Oryza meyeriana var. granulata]|uniref:Uncharacterized protein n=1 Tax=Oryza meyeriana var. granulata TaxID=110450 RepID=A0A6G1DP70_9ORYZ|nr:hypothetical protein E2562_024959 [Oryza meyeriana var. granulata]
MPYVEKVEKVEAGNRIYLLLPHIERPPESDRRDRAAGMPYLEKVEKVYDDKKKYVAYRNRLTERWSWRTSPSPPPFTGGRRITGHALHPDGRTIFVSVEKTHDRHPDDEEGNFSYDTERAE